MGNNATSHHMVRANAYHNKFELLDNEPSLIINPFLYLGGMYARQNPIVLEHLGITHILNMAAEQHLDTVLLSNRNISVKHILADDYEYYNIRQHFEESFEFIEDALAKNGRILIHCALGISRSPTIVIAYIMYRYGMTYQNAYQYVLNLRPNINPNNSFKMQLQDFEYELIGKSQQILNASQKAHKKQQKRYSDNFDSPQPQKSINNFSLNGMHPINVKGSRKNYSNLVNGVDPVAADKKTYVNQILQFGDNRNINPYFIDPTHSNHALPQKVINRKSSHLQHFHLQQQEKQRFNDQNARMIRNERATSMYNKSLKNFDDLNRFNYNLKLKENSYEKINSNLNNNYFNNPLNYVLAH